MANKIKIDLRVYDPNMGCLGNNELEGRDDAKLTSAVQPTIQVLARSNLLHLR